MLSLRIPGLAAGLVASCLASSQVALAQNTPARPRPYALRDVRLTADEDAPRKTILLRDGRIEAIQDAELTLPPDVWVVEADGLIALPAFIDAWSSTGCETPAPKVDQDLPASTGANVRIDMRVANRKGIQPAFRAADVLKLSEEEIERHRKAGFGVLLSAPGGEILAGASALATLRNAAVRDLVVDDHVFQHAAFAARGSGYPSTLMGYHAQLRQFMHDAEHQRELSARWAAGKPGPRPAWDDELAAAKALLDEETTLVCSAQTARDVERWARLADEFGLDFAIAGGREVWKAAELLAERDIPVFATLDWGEEVEDPDAEEEAEEEAEEDAEEDPEEQAEEGAEEDAEEDPEEQGEEGPEEGAEGDESAEDEDPDGEASSETNYEYTEPLGVRREKRRLWEERRDGAVRLREAGVRVLFCTGSGKPGDLLKNVRTLTEHGFPREAAVQALTAQPAEVLGADRHFGWLRPGHSATLCLWTAHPLDEGAQVAWSFVEGFPAEFDVKEEAEGEPAEGVDLSGRWRVTFPDDEDDREMVLTLEMTEAGKLTGQAKTTNPMDQSDLFADVTGKVVGSDVTLRMSFAVGDFEVELELEGEVEGDELSGTSRFKMPGNEEESRFEAERLPDRGGSR